MTIIIFWICIGLLTHVYILYPWTLRLKKNKSVKCEKTNKLVSIIIAAHNEENIIEEKIRNTLALNYPNIEILIGDDGSTDKTAEIVAQFPSVRLITREVNEGKAAVLNSLCKEAKGEILLFSDANSMLESSAIENITEMFADEKVGCVCGLLLLREASGTNLEHVYWKGESKLKKLESNFGAVMGSNGALYAIRAELYSELPTHKTVMDDFYITAKILMKNYHCVFCENASAIENSSTSAYGEFKRRIRIGRANYNFFFTFLPLLNPLHPSKAYIFLSHKLLRWLSPFLLLAVFVSSFILTKEHIFYKTFFAIELLFLVAALLRVRVCSYFLNMNFALFLGFCKSFFKEKNGAWERVDRN
ncbi:MAG: glycosyltransferase family 2 protein [Fibromonadales bacterium]|nr:glycosyltransferase family 2 protein [Fibromonadales bacterium]